MVRRFPLTVSHTLCSFVPLLIIKKGHELGVLILGPSHANPNKRTFGFLRMARRLAISTPIMGLFLTLGAGDWTVNEYSRKEKQFITSFSSLPDLNLSPD
jgi:hypothetical protein